LKIQRGDVEKALKTLASLGSGCSLFKKDYVCTVPFSLSDDSAELMGVAEEVLKKNNFIHELLC
jgi:hypothetical protein